MLISKKKEEFNQRIRKEQREKLFQKIRMEMLATFESKKQEESKFSTSFNGQREILQFFRLNQNQQLSALHFQQINTYICSFKGIFSDEFKDVLMSTVFQKFNKNGSALACIANMLSKSQQCQIILNMDIKKIVSQILSANTNIEEGRMNNSKVITYLLYQLVRVYPQKFVLEEIKLYYPLIIKQNGYFELIVLLLLSQASKYRILLPEKAIIEAYLSRQLIYDTVSITVVYKLYEMLDNYLRYDQTTHLYQHYCNWIELRLKERLFPLYFKPELIKMMTAIIHGLDPNIAFVQYISKLNVLKEILYLVRFGNLQCKIASLEFISVLVNISNAELLNYYVEENLIIQILVYSLDLRLEAELTFKILTSLALIIESNKRYAIRAHQLGLANIVERFIDCKFQKIIIEGAMLVQDRMNRLQA